MTEHLATRCTAADLELTQSEFVTKLAQQREEACQQSQTPETQERLRQWAAKNRNRGAGYEDSPHQARPAPVATSAPSQQTLSRPGERLSASEIEALLEDAKQASCRMKELREAEARRKP